jgi:outer membrane receptor protein involved in Fe transport
VEISGQYRPLPWIELNTDLAFTRARYQGSLASLQAVYQLPGDYIANAPVFIGSAGVLVDHLRRWSGSLQWRALGPYPVVDGSQYPRDKGYSELNLDIGYKVNPGLKVQASLFNLTNTRANGAAFDYALRLTPTSQSVTGLQVHPLEPISARFMVTANF